MVMAELHDCKDRAPNLKLIAMLERHLEHAKAGEIRSAVLITSRDDNATSHAWSIDGRTWKQPMLGEIVFAQTEFAINLSLTISGGLLKDE